MSLTINNHPATTTQLPLQSAAGNIALTIVLTASLTPASIDTITSAEQDFTITGLAVGDQVVVTPPGLTAGASLTGARVSAANTLTLTYTNPTVAPVTPLAGAHSILVFRPMQIALTDGFPTSLPLP